MAYKYGPLKTRIYPEPQDLLDIMDKSVEDDSSLRDQRPLTFVLQRAMRINSRLKGHWKTRKTAISSYSWRLVGGEDNARDEATIRMKKAINYIIDKFYNLPAYGRIGFDVKWAYENGGWVTKPIKQIKTIELDAIDESFGIRNEIGEYSKLEVGSTFFGATCESDLESVLYTEIFRFDALKEQANYIKKLKGILQIIDRGGGDDDRANAELAAQTVIKNNYLLTSDAIEFKLNQITSSSGTAFTTALEKFDKDISIAILGQANTSDLPDSGGSRAALDVLKLVAADIMFSDMILLERFINEHLIYWDSQKNFKKPAEWEFKFSLEEDYDFSTIAAAIVELVTAGVPIVRSEAYQMLRMKEPEEGDVLLQAAG